MRGVRFRSLINRSCVWANFFCPRFSTFAIMRRGLFSSFPSSFAVVLAFLSIATHYRYALGSAIDSPDGSLFSLEDPQQEDLFSNNNSIFDDSSSSSSTDIANSQQEEIIWASSLQPIDADLYISAADNSNAILPSSSSPTSDNSFLSSANACLTEGPSSLSGDLFVRSADGMTVVETPSDFCFQKPDTKTTPPLTLPNLFDLLQPGDENDLLAPFDTFPRRPLCPGRNPMHLLCCARDREKETGFAWNCIKCT